MDYILITFQAETQEKIDLKAPTFVTIEELLRIFSEALGVAVGPESRLQAEPLGRILDNCRTLEQEGVGPGALLTLI